MFWMAHSFTLYTSLMRRMIWRPVFEPRLPMMTFNRMEMKINEVYSRCHRTAPQHLQLQVPTHFECCSAKQKVPAPAPQHAEGKALWCNGSLELLEIHPVVLSSVLQPPKVASRPLPVPQLLDTTWAVSDPTCIKEMRQMLIEIVGHRLEDVQRV